MGYHHIISCTTNYRNITKKLELVWFEISHHALMKKDNMSATATKESYCIEGKDLY